MARKIKSALLVASVLLVILIWRLARSDRPKPLVELRGAKDTLLIAATGDWFVFGPMPSEKGDRGYDGVRNILRGSSLGLTTLEQDLLNEKNAPTINHRALAGRTEQNAKLRN